MQRIGWNDSDMARNQVLGNAVDGYFQFAFDDFVDFFLRVGSPTADGACPQAKSKLRQRRRRDRD